MTATAYVSGEAETSTETTRLPSVWRLALARGGIEIKQFFREKDGVIFSFSFPAILLMIFATIFSERVEGTNVSVSQLYAAGMIAAGIMSTSLLSLGIGIATDRDDGTLKRLYATPMPRAAYFGGKVVQVLMIGFAEVVLLVVVGVALFDLELPTAVDRWATFAWVFVLGVTASALLGIAMSSLPRSARSASAVITMPFIVLQFISGVFIPLTTLPGGLYELSSFFPLKWMCQGFRSVFLPDSLAAAVEPAGTWEHGRIALVLMAWCIGGLVLCLTTFRWTARDR